MSASEKNAAKKLISNLCNSDERYYRWYLEAVMCVLFGSNVTEV